MERDDLYEKIYGSSKKELKENPHLFSESDDCLECNFQKLLITNQIRIEEKNNNIKLEAPLDVDMKFILDSCRHYYTPNRFKLKLPGNYTTSLSNIRYLVDGFKEKILELEKQDMCIVIHSMVKSKDMYYIKGVTIGIDPKLVKTRQRLFKINQIL